QQHRKPARRNVLCHEAFERPHAVDRQIRIERLYGVAHGGCKPACIHGGANYEVAATAGSLRERHKYFCQNRMIHAVVFDFSNHSDDRGRRRRLTRLRFIQKNMFPDRVLIGPILRRQLVVYDAGHRGFFVVARREKSAAKQFRIHCFQGSWADARHLRRGKVPRLGRSLPFDGKRLLPAAQERALRTPRVLNPGSALRTWNRLSRISPAPTRSTSEIASSPTTSVSRNRLRAVPVPLPGEFSFKASFTSVRDAWSTGKIPKKIPVRSDSANVNARTQPSTRTSPILGTAPDAALARPCVAHQAMRSPKTPPRKANKTLSVNS